MRPRTLFPLLFSLALGCAISSTTQPTQARSQRGPAAAFKGGEAVRNAQQTSSPEYLDQAAELRSFGVVDGEGPVPLMVFLPHTGGTATGYFDDVAEHVPLAGFMALLPAGRPVSTDYLPRFRPFIDAYETRLMADIERAKQDPRVDPERIYISGFSLGGDLSWAMIMRHPEVFRGALIMGSRCSHRAPRQSFRTLLGRSGRILFARGSAESAVRVRGMERAHARTETAGVTTTIAIYPGAHSRPDSETLSELFSQLVR